MCVHDRRRTAVVLRAAVAALALLIAPAFAAEAAGPSLPEASRPAIPAGKDNDLKLYKRDGRIVKGREALAGMGRADLVLWLAGNQFFAMDDVIGAFRRHRPELRIGLITLPPGLLLQAIEAGGWTFEGRDVPGRPDVYASVNLGHLRKLRAAGLMTSYRVYMHNELQIMVAAGNPKRISGIADLAGPGIRTSMPNPVNEGIMQFYGRKVLERHGLWETVSGGRDCVHCQATPSNWFTAVHHRETPERIRDGLSDAGLVWKTEVLRAVQDGLPVEGVELPSDDSLRHDVSYVVGIVSGSPHEKAAEAFLQFLASPEGQEAYARFGFVRAEPGELQPKPIP